MKIYSSAQLPRRKLWLGILLTGILLLAGACLLASRFGNFSFTPPLAQKPSFSADSAAYPSRLRAAGSALLDAAARPVSLKGLMAPDPARLNEKGKFNREFYQGLSGTGANVLRIPVHPERWQLDPDYLARYLDPLVTWSGELGMYAIIDLHFIGNVETGAGSQMPDLKTPSKEFTLAFWRKVAAYFKDAPHVIFEIVNEPQGISPEDWRRTATEIVSVVRAAGAEQLIIIGGVEYSKDLSWVLAGAVAGENLAYAAHIYPAHAQTSWDYWFGKVSAQVPVLVTEWGWIDSAADRSNDYLVGSALSYGEPFLTYLNQHHIGWVACWYDDNWIPAMFMPGFSGLNDYGKFINARLAALK